MTERTIFLAALDKHDLAERTAWLDEACAGDVPLRQRVEALLRSHETAGSFLAVPAVEQVVPPPNPGHDQTRTPNQGEVSADDLTGETFVGHGAARAKADDLTFLGP